MRVMIGMSGGVDSSVAAALLHEQGHDVVGVTMRLWGGESDTGCCSVSDVDDARRVAQQIGIEHVVFNFSDEFDEHVVQPYVEAHQQGITPNPCIECNRHLKFERLAERADELGFDAVATGHHARIGSHENGRLRLERGADLAKDQSYVLHMVTAEGLAHTSFPIGHMTKGEVRAHAARLGLRTAGKPDSQDVCFISRADGRETFLGNRIPLRTARVVDREGTQVGEVPSVEMVTLGQRRGLGVPGGGPVRYVIGVDASSDQPTVIVGDADDLLVRSQIVHSMTWVDETFEGDALAQTSAHGDPRPCHVTSIGDRQVQIDWGLRSTRIAPGQSVVLYDSTNTWVIGGGIAQHSPL